MKKLLRFLGILLLIVVILAGLGVGALTLFEYRPAEVEAAEMSGTANSALQFRTDSTVTLVTWNVGYGALGKDADFFMDGGTKVYTVDSADQVKANLKGITNRLIGLSADIILLQEVDADSARSFWVDERSALSSGLSGRVTAYARNYKALYVPYPIPPMGKVESGLFTLSKRGMSEAYRVSLPSPFSWPVSTVNLKRCLLVARYPLADSDRDLVVINVHLDAYTDDASRTQQTKALFAFMDKEVAKGNYVIAGGDFNASFDTYAEAYPVRDEKNWHPGVITAAEYGDYGVHMDPGTPTCRSLRTSYDGSNDFQFYMLDGFIVSPNIVVTTVKTYDEGFAYSDHNPVKITVRLN